MYATMLVVPLHHQDWQVQDRCHHTAPQGDWT
jgi:hypothetical protein